MELILPLPKENEYRTLRQFKEKVASIDTKIEQISAEIDDLDCHTYELRTYLSEMEKYRDALEAMMAERFGSV